MGLKTIYSNIKFFIFQLICILAKMVITFEPVGIFSCVFSMLYSGEQILSFKSCLVFYAGDSLMSELRLYTVTSLVGVVGFDIKACWMSLPLVGSQSQADHF